MSKELHESPKIIWLQIDPDGIGPAEWDTTDGATWCKDKINDSDVKYVRADRIEELERERDTAWAQAHRLALELECLIMDTKDNAVVSKWWDSAFEAIEEYQTLKPEAQQ